MKNSGDLGGCYPTRPSASVDNTLLDLQNSSYPAQPHSIIAKYVMWQRFKNNVLWCWRLFKRCPACWLLITGKHRKIFYTIFLMVFAEMVGSNGPITGLARLGPLKGIFSLYFLTRGTGNDWFELSTSSTAAPPPKLPFTRGCSFIWAI